MIHIIIGTKAQLIKMAPVMVELKNRDIDYNFIFTGQHRETINDLINEFNIKKPDIVLHKGNGITKIHQVPFWIIKTLFNIIINKNKIFGKNKNDIIVVHGDTFSTLLGAIAGRILRIKVAHIESGLRSYNIFHPFPEEITRLITFYLTDYYFCPGRWALDNLKRFKKVKIDTKQNTLIDSLNLVIKKINNSINERYCVVSIHRFENIFNKKRFEEIINIIEKLSDKIKVVFVMHKPTKQQLEKLGFVKALKQNKNIVLKPRMNYSNFINLVYNSEFVITDGGSNQEECSYLGIPCLLMRKKTERIEGLGKNVILSCYDRDIISDFMDNYKKYRLRLSNYNVSPSRIIVDYLGGFS